MTTGETLFFRDTVPFEILRTTILPELIERCRLGGRPMRIWSAASSSGQEAYSVAMLLSELNTQLGSVRVDVVATDYATHALNKARRGIFTQTEVQRGLPDRFLRQYFVQVAEGYRIGEDIRRRVSFREINLLESFRSLGQFDIILCRNVLIYFDTLTKKDVLDRLANSLAPGGYLFLGATESAFGITDQLVRIPKSPPPCTFAARTWPRRSYGCAPPHTPRSEIVRRAVMNGAGFGAVHRLRHGARLA